MEANMVSLWNRLLGLPNNRVASEIIYRDLSVGDEWISEVFDFLEECELMLLNAHNHDQKKYGKNQN